MAKLFGFSIENNDQKPKSIVSPVPPNNEDGVDYYVQSGFYGQYVDIEGVYRTEYDLIRRYREMALHPECDSAIESVVNEAIVSDLYDSPVEIELSNLNASDRLKQVIREEFKYIKEMMDFDKKCHEIFRNWYVDGRLFYLKVIDQKRPDAGIQELRYIDPMKMKHVRQEKKNSENGTNGFRNLNLMSKSFSADQEYNFPEIEEYFIYTPTPNFPSGTISGGSKKGVKIAKDTVTYCTSGLVDRNKGTILSYLHKAIKSLNQLRMIEDSLVIYRLCLVGDTRVKTNRGYSYIKDIQVGDTVYSYDNRIDKLVETTVSNKWLTGTKQTFKVKSKHHSIVGTDTHPVLIYDNETKEVKYVPIKDLQAKRHSLTYIKPEEINDTEIKDITISDSFPEYIFKEATQTKKNFLYKLIHEKSISRDSLDGLPHKVCHSDKKYIESVKELCNSIGIASGEFLFENGDWCIHIGEYELPKFEKIISVEIAEIEDVYDIEVSHEKHNFVANGIVVHNSRAPERRIFYIDVGNLPKVKAEQYLKEVMSRYRNKLVYDACLAMDTRVPLLDGRTLTLSEITDEFNNGEKLWTYSCDPITGKFAPGIISWAGVTRKDEKVMKITLDNGKSVTCTYDHKFPVWGKGKVQAKDLVIGDSMIPHYNRLKNIPGGRSTYEQIFENESKKWLYTHRLVSSWKDNNNILNEYNYNLNRIHEEKKTVHHKDYDRYNNSPDNLVRMSRDDHFDYHKQHSSYSGKIGGSVCAQRKREKGLPFFNMSMEKRVENGKLYGKIGGKIALENKLGIHGLSKDDIIKNSRKGSEVFINKLKSDPIFKEKFIQNIKNSWTDEMRELFRERGKTIPIEHFEKMSQIGNKVRWSNPNSRKKLSESQKIVYDECMYELLKNCSNSNMTQDEIIDKFNEDIDFENWNELNKGKFIKNRSKLDKFTKKDLRRLCENLGFNGWREYKNSVLYKNHKIVKIEYLEETIDVGTLTIDREEKYHNYHTFALDCGIYTCNSDGSVRDDRKFMSMLEDFWLPRREGGRGTEITTLPGGQNLGELSDIEYFQKKLYRSLGVPETRIAGGGDGFNLGRSSEILRDELMFSKFVGRLRKRFSNLFNDILRTQLLLKNIVSPEDWEKMSDHIQYDFLYDNHFAELKEAELLTNRLTLATTVEPYIGKYYSTEYVRKKILRQTDSEIIEIDEQIQSEIEKGILPNPNAPVDENGNPLPPEQGQDIQQGSNGEVPMEPSIDTSSLEIPEPKGGKI